MAALWVIDDPVGPVDAIVVLGGGADYRPFKAAEMYRVGLSKRILVANVKLSPTAELGLHRSETETSIGVLTNRGVNPDDIIRFGKDVASTRDEAVALREWAGTNAIRIRSVAIPTDPFHTRRVQWFFSKVLSGIEIRVTTPVANPTDYTSTNWWAHEAGLIAFQNEVVKSGFYRLKY
jgi:uncharacterized SAM-binding protein YcdF (DUF218 family)